jgi:hypothetical protein
VSIYVLVAIVRKELGLEVSLWPSGANRGHCSKYSHLEVEQFGLKLPHNRRC